MVDRLKQAITDVNQGLMIAKGTECSLVKISMKSAEEIIALLNESVSQGVVDQIRWERDTALGQLAEIGKGLGEKMDDVVELVKSKDGKQEG